MHALVVGSGVEEAAKAAAKLPGAAKVIVADLPEFEHSLAEPVAALLVSLAPAYSHLLAAATASGKNIMPRVAALLDEQPISDIVAVIDAETFVRPIFAGNALATVTSSDRIKVITVRAASSIRCRQKAARRRSKSCHRSRRRAFPALSEPS